MMYKLTSICILSLLLSLTNIHCMQDLSLHEIENLQSRSSYFNTKKLANPREIDRLLQEDGFETVSFITPDGLELEGRFLHKEKSDHTVIIGGGFVPGLLQGNATGVPLLKNSNASVLLFNARGHGNSEGDFLKKIWHYGTHETKDLEGAISYAQENACATSMPSNPTPILFWGTCASAHFALRLAGEQPEFITKNNVLGIIADSPWRGMEDISKTAIQETFRDGCGAKITRKLYPQDTKEEIKKRLLYRLLTFSSDSFLNYIVRPTAFFMGARKNLPITTFTPEKAAAIPAATKVLYVMSEDDTMAPIEHMEQLVAATPNKELWRITQPSKHSCHILKYPKEYYALLRGMQEYVVEKNKIE